MVILYILAAAMGAVVLYLLFLLVCALLVNPRKNYETHSKFYRFLLNSATAAAIKITRVHVHTTGTEKLPKNEKLLFVGNHISNFDPIVTWYTFLNWKVSFISKPENFKIPLFGRIIRKCCFLPIDRENPRKAIHTINQAAKLLKTQEVSIGVYPEGTRSKTARLLPFHNGVFKIAQKADAAVSVVCVRNTNQIHRNYPWRRTDVYLDVLEVLPAANVKAAGTQMLSIATEHLLKQHIESRDCCQRIEAFLYVLWLQRKNHLTW